MTAAAAYIPPKPVLNQSGQNPEYLAVLAVDGRITDEHGTIYTDHAVKFCQAGPLVCVFAGDTDAFQEAIRLLVDDAKNTKRIQSAKDFARAWLAARQPGSGSWEALVYHTHDWYMSSVDSDGTVLRTWRKAAAIGTGADVAMGFLSGKGCASPKPWSAAKAKTNVRAAIRAAAELNSTVGPRCTVLTIAPNGKVSVRG